MSDMTARSPTAFLISATIHGLFAAAMFYTAYALKDEMIDKAKVFELVAGEGDNYAATEAPALGTPDGLKFEMPAGPKIAPVFTPPEPIAAPEPVIQPAVETVPISPVVKPEPKPKPEPSPVVKSDPKTATKPDPAVPNFVNKMKRVQVRLDSKQRAQREKEAKAAALAAKNAEIAAQKAALLKGNGSSSKTPRIDAEGIAKGVLGGSTANKVGGAGGTALTRAEQDELGSYFALVKMRIKEAMVPVDADDNIVAKVEFHVSQAGTLSQVRIIKTSGNADYDQAVLDAFHKVSSVRRESDGQGELVSTLAIRKKDLD